MTPREFNNYTRGHIENVNIQNKFNVMLTLSIYNLLGQLWAKNFRDVKIGDIYKDDAEEIKGMSELEKAKLDRKKLTDMMASEEIGGTPFDNLMESLDKQETIRIPKKK